MKIGDIVTMRPPTARERYGLGLIQKIVPTRRVSPTGRPLGRDVYQVLWPDGAISNQYHNEIVLIAKA